MRPHYFVAFLTLLLPLAAAALFTDRFWKPIENISDPHVIKAAEFAVSKYNTRVIQKLVFEIVVGGTQMFASGIIYDLVFTAKNESLPSSTAKYEAAGIWEKYFPQPMVLMGFGKA